MRIKVGSYARDVELTFQRLKLLCERDYDPYLILAEQRMRPTPSLGLSTSRAVDVLALVTGDEPDTLWQLAVEHKPISVIDAAADVLIAFATAGAPAQRKGKAAPAAEDGAPPKG